MELIVDSSSCLLHVVLVAVEILKPALSLNCSFYHVDVSLGKIEVMMKS